jgi:prepilin peptidase CpaA
MTRLSFSDPTFGWTFFGVLVAFTVVAAYTDLRTALVPKWLTLSMLAAGVLFNLGRGFLLGHEGTHSLWAFPHSSGAGWGLCDGLVFTLSGFLAGFGLFFLFWIMGLCGGGDVKLFAAVGAWVGPVLVIYVMLVSIGVLIAFILVRLAVGDLNPLAARQQALARGSKKATPAKQTAKPREEFRMTYSLPVAVGAAVVLLWKCGADLHLKW